MVPRGTAAEGEVAVVFALESEEEDGEGGAKPCATSTTPPREAIAHRTAAAEAAVRREEGILMVRDARRPTDVGMGTVHPIHVESIPTCA